MTKVMKVHQIIKFLVVALLATSSYVLSVTVEDFDAALDEEVPSVDENLDENFDQVFDVDTDYGPKERDLHVAEGERELWPSYYHHPWSYHPKKKKKKDKKKKVRSVKVVLYCVKFFNAKCQMMMP